MRTYYSYDGTPGTTERGRRERARQDAMIAAAGGVAAYLQGARQNHVDADVSGVVRCNRPTGGDKSGA